MARDGSGNYSIPESAFVFEEVIDEVAVNHIFADIATALTQSISADGQTPITANLPMGGFKHTGVGNATARTDYAAAGQIQGDSINWCGTAGGTVNALTLSPSPTLSTYVAGQRFRFIAAGFNTGAVTIAVSGQTAKALWQDGAACVGDELWNGSIHEIVYDGTRFHLITIGVGPSSTHANAIINPGFVVAQEATSATVAANTGRYVLDQWYHGASASQATTVQQLVASSSISVLPHSHIHYMRVTSDLHGYINHPIEDVRSFAGKPVTLTFWARSSVNGATVTPSLYQYFGVGGTATVITAFSTARTLTTDWQRFRQTITVPALSGSETIGTANAFTVHLDLVGNGVSIDFAYMQLELGTKYTVIQQRSLAEEMQLCQRYWQSSYAYGTAPGAASTLGSIHNYVANTITPVPGNVDFPVQMRVTPTVTIYSPVTGTAGKFHDVDNLTEYDMEIAYQSEKSFAILATASVLIVGHRGIFQWKADARI